MVWCGCLASFLRGCFVGSVFGFGEVVQVRNVGWRDVGWDDRKCRHVEVMLFNLSPKYVLPHGNFVHVRQLILQERENEKGFLPSYRYYLERKAGITPYNPYYFKYFKGCLANTLHFKNR